MSEQAQLRYKDISIMKGLAIIMMVAGHSYVGSGVESYVGMFHMPLFFFVSGYCFKDKYLDDFKTYVLKKLKGIYLPYIGWGTFFLLLHNVFVKVGLLEAKWLGWMDLRILLGYLLRMRHEEQLLGGFWFLHCLFWGVILFWILKKLLRDKWLVLMVAAIGGMLFSNCSLHLTTFCIYDKDIWACFYVALGYIAISYSRNWKDFFDRTSSLSLCVWAVTFFCGLGIYKFQFADCMMDLDLKMAWNPIVAVLGILATLILSNVILKVHCAIDNWVSYVGDHTLSVLIWHFMAFKIVSFCYVMINSDPNIGKMSDFPTIISLSHEDCGWLIYMLVGVSIPLALNWIWFKIKCRITVFETKLC